MKKAPKRARSIFWILLVLTAAVIAGAMYLSGDEDSRAEVFQRKEKAMMEGLPVIP